MPVLSLNLDTLSPTEWEVLFGAYVIANGSHWTGAPFSAVKDILAKKGAYEFGLKAMGTWHSKFRLEVLKDGALSATFVRNPDLPPRMQEHLDAMEKTFLQRILVLTKKE